jgi:fatty aldehyde-generating acyl-ACP reductase
VLPYLSAQPPAFVFLTHLRDDDDLHRIGASSFLRRYSDGEDDFRRKMCSLPPLVAGEISFGFGPVRGEVVVVMRKPDELLSPSGGRAVIEGLEVALARGASVIGLGALVAPATAGGARLLRHLPDGVTLTNTNAYTAVVVQANVHEAAAALGLGRSAQVAVIGCTGSVGVPASRLLAADGFRLVLVGRTVERVRRHLGDLEDEAKVAAGLDSALGSDVVVLLTSDLSARLTPEHVSPGSIVIDFAQPANVVAVAVAEFERRGVAVVEGGIVRIPDYWCSVDLGLADPADTTACVAEAYLFAREGIQAHSVGRPTPELARRLERAALRQGIRPQPLRSVAGGGDGRVLRTRVREL